MNDISPSSTSNTQFDKVPCTRRRHPQSSQMVPPVCWKFGQGFIGETDFPFSGDMENSSTSSVNKEIAEDHLRSSTKLCAAILQSTYILAKVAQDKLLRESTKADPDLRRVVIHTIFVNSLARHLSVGSIGPNQVVG